MGNIAPHLNAVIVLNILLLEDNDEDAILIQRALRGTGYAHSLKRARNRAEFAAQLDAVPDLILSDFHLPDFDALGALDLLKKRGLDVPLILVSGLARDEEVLAAMKRGAADFLSKDRLVRLGQAITATLEYRALRRQANEIQRALERSREELDYAFNHAASGMALTSLDARWLKVNQALCGIIGYAESELLATDCHSITHPDDIAGDVELTRRLVAGEVNSTQREKRYLHKLGHVVWVQVTASLVRGRDGEPRYRMLQVIDISNRKEAEERFLATFNQAAVGIAHTDVEGKILEANHKLREILGYSEAELLRLTTRELTHPDDRDHQDGLRLELLSGARPSFSGEKRYVRADGRIIWVNRTVTLARQATSGSPYLIQVFEDITERKHTEERLERANRARRVLAECNHILVHATDETEMLENMCRIFVESGGYKMAWVGLATGDPARPVYPAAHAGFGNDAPMTGPAAWGADGRYRGFMSEVMASGEPHIARNILKNPTHAGRLARALQRGFQSSIALPLKGDGRILGAIAMYAVEPDAFDDEEIALLKELADDIAFGIVSLRTRIARRNAEAALRESEQRFRETFEQAAVGITRVDLNGVLVDVNQKFCDMLGYGKDELLGKSIKDITHPADYGRGAQYRAQLTHGAMKSAAGEKRFIRKDGTALWARRTMSTACDETGKPLYVISVVEDISEHKELERRFELTFDHAAVGMTQASLDGCLLQVNHKYADMLGYTREELRGMSSEAITHPEDMSETLQTRRDLIDGRVESATSEKRLVRKDGHVIWARRSVSVARSTAGEPLYFIAVVEDITDRKQIEVERARLAAIVGNSNDAIITRDLDRTILTWNLAAEKLFGWSAQEAIGQSILIMVPPERRGENAHRRELVHRGLPVPAYDTVRLTKDGRRIDVSLSQSAIKNERGEVIAVSLVLHDITERKQAEAERARLAAIVESSADAIISRSLDGTILTWNAAAERMFGYGAAEAIGRDVSFLIPPDRHEEAYGKRSLLNKGHAIPPYDTVRVTKDGRRVDVSLTLSPIKEPGGKMIGVSLVFRDISERKALEERFHATFEQAAVGIMHSSLDRRILAVNQKLCDMLGYSAEELTRMRAPQIHHPEDSDADQHLERKLVADEINTFSFEKRYIRKDGRVIWCNRTVSLLRDESGRPKYFIRIIEDVTERKELERRYRETFEQAAVGLTRVDLNGVLVECNQKFCDMLGYTKDELLGKTIRDITHPDDYGQGVRYRADVVGGVAKSRAGEKRFLRKDGTIIWARRTMSTACDETGKPQYVISVVEDITERKHAEERYRATFDNAPVGIMHTSIDDDKIVHANSKLCEMLGYTHDELVCLTTDQVIDPDHVGADRTKYREKMLKGELDTFSSERLYRRKDGSGFWVNRTVSLARDWTGKPLYFIRIIEDVSERKRAEEAIARERVLLRAVVDTSPDHIYVKDRVGCYLLVNETGRKIRGLRSDDEIVGKTVFEVLPRDIAEKLDAEDRAVMDTGVPLMNREESILFGDAGAGPGEKRWHLTTKMPMKDAAGQVIGIVGVNRDITERKRAEEAVAQERALMRTIIDTLPDYIYVKDRDGRFLLANKAWLSARDIPGKDPAGKTVFDFFPEDIAEKLAAQDDRVIETGVPILDQEQRIIVKMPGGAQGEERWSATTKVPMRDASGNIIGTVGVSRDITERRRMEQALRQSEERYRDLFEASPLPMWVWSDDTLEFLVVNQASVDHYGYSREEFMRMNVRDIWAGDEHARYEEDIRNRAHEQVLRLQRKHRAKDGRIIDVEVTARRFVHGGRPVWLTLLNDVTERKRAEAALRESEEHLRAMFDQATVGITVSGLDLQYMQVNDKYCDIVGYSRDELLRMSVRDVNFPEHLDDATKYREKLFRGEIASTVREKPLRRKDGTAVWVSMVTSVVRGNEGKPQHFISVIQDISERKRAEVALRQSEEQFQQLANNIPQVFWIADTEQRQTLYVSPAAETLIGRPLGEIQSSPRLLVRALHKEDRLRVRAARKDAAAGGYDQTYRIVRPDGSIRWVRDRAFPVHDDSGAVHRIAGIAEDITDRKMAEERLLHLAHYDVLTSLPNRVLFYDRLRQALAQAKRNQWTVGVMFIDVDRFKKVNDTLGHAVGDKLLQQVSERLMRSVRAGDTVGRLGGDEFAIVLSNLSSVQDANPVAQKLMASFNEPFRLEGAEIYVTASIGITLYPDDSTDQDVLIKNADTAMYRAKEVGRNSYQFYTPEMNARALEVLSMENSLRHALDRDEFLLYFQPKAGMADGDIVGVEALLRWRHPARGLVSPGEFIPVLEDTGLIVAVGEWVLKAVCAQIREWEPAGIKPVPVAVNLSARQFADRNLGPTVRRILEEYQVDPSLIELEITESSLMANTEEAVRTLEYLEELGVGLSIDDFGTGYSSFGYLKRFPLTALKIDRSFVQDITTDSDDATITRAVISMAHSLGLKVIAEGVETESQLAFLAEYGCDEIQGYYFSRPLAVDECSTWLRERRCLQRVPQALETAPVILLVDDDDDALTLLKRSLAKDGYRMLTARNAHDALLHLGNGRVDVVISDQNMPGIPGSEFLQRVKALSPRTVRIMTSGFNDFQAVADAVNKSEIFRFLPKSLSEEKLRSSVREALQARAESVVSSGGYASIGTPGI